MNPILLDIGFIKIYWYSFFIFLALLIGGNIVLKETKKFDIPENFTLNLFFWLIPISLIGARLYYVIFNFSYYSQNLIDIFKIWEGGLAIHGGLLAGLLFVIFYCRKYKISFKYFIDFTVPALLIGQAIGRWGNFFNSEAHGGGTTIEFLKSLFVPDFVIEGMKINGYYYQPTFYYESLWCLVGFIIIILIRKYKYLKVNQLTSFYLVWYGIGRLFVESLRTDSLMLGSFKVAQIVSLFMIIVGLLLYIKSSKGSKLSNQYHDIDNFRESK
ncbi:MAG: prolipoprotein diacylglyceryl transferase [Bacilli bacterium]